VIAARLEAPRAEVRPVTVTAPARRAGLAWPRWPSWPPSARLPRVCPRAPGHPRGGRGESSPRHRHRARGAPVIAKYTGVLAAADVEVFTTTTTFQIMQSLRSTAGPADQSTPDRNAAGPGQRRSWCGPGDLRAGLDPGRAHCGDQAPSPSAGRCRIGAEAFVAGVRGAREGRPGEKGTAIMKLTVMTHVTVDGVVQGNGGASDEDRRNGFERGAWARGRATTRPGR